ncbi:tRNA (adenosine(37)-N6)-threonylcarbamoyltransferase complex dimerization subunit type 1 TsaB [Dyadobacter sp. CY107]|uniref:tRNA (adenosine(37)-N6)-threonylcarbamoyltransferase complex dimerization subunit type 1 TsaB n=1 Tax=Dyadobacter fanqingshengii TaxID=2906443 RepID=UPI001F4870CE|nr:tRNA (adenosine(37)-N6)-threonylcarbamoyltransferase complex dimerization subunit type 1 TsaB [Dyadobacter fanqingshengii]MCF2504139.1 tRNA (adenosine(37)-N6)-threonylcarbamoyltransferase complex dimerization subunit type 1 TsaB [Dyadobacter fanqingshengii]
MLLLSIDTSIRGCSVAVHENSTLLANYDLHTDRSSSSMLTTLMETAVKHAGFTLNDLDAIAVAKGPGSYTGLRVGVSSAKGLCYALDKPMIAINTLEAMALQLNAFYPGHLLCPMIDARRMEVYAAVLDAENNFVQQTQAIIMDEHSFQDLLLKHRIVFFGDGAVKCQQLLGTHPNAIFPKKESYPSAITVGELAAKAFQNEHFEDVATFEPYYLKDFMSPPSKKVRSLA